MYVCMGSVDQAGVLGGSGRASLRHPNRKSECGFPFFFNSFSFSNGQGRKRMVFQTAEIWRGARGLGADAKNADRKKAQRESGFTHCLRPH